MSPRTVSYSLFLVFALLFLAACGSNSYSPHSAEPANPPALSSSNVNLIFVVSEDLAYNAAGDINSTTANLTNQGLQRSLLAASYLQQSVLGMQNVTQIYSLEPMTHLQTVNNYPDMVGLETIQQFAMLNHATLFDGTWFAGQSFPINASYAEGAVPANVAAPANYCSNCQGLDFNNLLGDNDKLLTSVVQANVPGFYVFSAPWETVSALMASLNQRESYKLNLPAGYVSPNFIYAIAIAPTGSASLATYDTHITPPQTYPVLSPPPPAAACATPFTITVTGGQGGAVIPAGTNTNETLYFIRHADAHPQTLWNDNNYVGAGQWRALDLPYALAGKMTPTPTEVYSIDPSQFGVGSISDAGDYHWSTVAPALTAEPYAIANGLPYNLVTGFELSDPQAAAQPTSEFFFSGGRFSNQTVLVAWAFQFVQPAVDSLLASYRGKNQPPRPWSSDDYDSIWTIKLDAVGNVTVSNASCEGINSSLLPGTPPQF